MSGRFGRYEATSLPQGQRQNPRASHQNHPPSPTLLLRGLAPSVDDEMILQALQRFRPLQARTIYDKNTGEPRGFAFVDFDSVESATEAVRDFGRAFLYCLVSFWGHMLMVDMDATAESRPLVLQHRNVSVSFTDGFRKHPNSGRAGGESWGARHDVHHGNQRHGEHWQPRPDWICDECNVTNFARRTSCFQCNAPKTAQTKEVPATAAFRTEQIRSHHGEAGADEPSFAPQSSHSVSLGDGEMGSRRRGAGDVPPSQVLMVRLLPPNIEEGELHVAFAEFEGVQDIRLIRDRATNLSRGFGFVEFRDIDAATEALKRCGGLVVQNTHVEVSYARDTLATRSHYPAESSRGPRSGSSMAVTALEQAQWSLSQGRGADAANNDQDVTPPATRMSERCIDRPTVSDCDLQQNSVADDVSALLNSAAAEVVPRFEEPQKMWPAPFETAGGSYVYASEYGLYWDPDSMFYYDAHTKVYHNSFTGTYYRCVNPECTGAAAFQVFVPPLPEDNGAYEDGATAKVSLASKPALRLSLKKDKKKPLGISFGIKTTAFAAPASGFEKTKQAKSGVAISAASAVSVASIGMKRKSADNIAKWSQRQRETKEQERGGASALAADHAPSTTYRGGAVSSDSSQQKATAATAPNVADSVIDSLTDVPQEVPICLLCRRKFGSLEMLRKHEKLSKLHLDNLAKAKENKQHIAAQYREHEKELERDAKKQRQEERGLAAPAPGNNHGAAPGPASKQDPEPTASSIESGIGGKMLKMMGWKSGQGLGKHGTGITAPIKAAGQGGRSDTAGLGAKAPLSVSVDLSDVTSDKERRQRLARARYDADNA